MSVCRCISCGYESYILCCAEEKEYYSLCAPCLSSASFVGQACYRCNRSTTNVVYRLQRQLARQQQLTSQPPLFNPMAINTSKDQIYGLNSHPPQNHNLMRKSSSSMPYQAYTPPPMRHFSEKNSNDNGGLNQNEWFLTQEDIRFADQVLDKPLNCQSRLQKERERNMNSANTNFPNSNVKLEEASYTSGEYQYDTSSQFSENWRHMN